MFSILKSKSEISGSLNLFFFQYFFFFILRSQIFISHKRQTVTHTNPFPSVRGLHKIVCTCSLAENFFFFHFYTENIFSLREKSRHKKKARGTAGLLPPPPLPQVHTLLSRPFVHLGNRRERKKKPTLLSFTLQNSSLLLSLGGVLLDAIAVIIINVVVRPP